MISAEEKRRKFESGPKLTPEEAVEQIKDATSDWDFEAVSIGFPAPVRDGKITDGPETSRQRLGRIRFCEGARANRCD